jgi:hypothetical protein
MWQTGLVDEGAGPDNEVAVNKELTSDIRPTLEHEYYAYKALAGHESISDMGVHGRLENVNILVTNLLGPSLVDQFRRYGKCHYPILSDSYGRYQWGGAIPGKRDTL